MEVKDVFSKRLKEIRERSGLSQTKLAEELGISRGTVSFYENGDRTPDIETLDKIVKYFNVSVEYLLGYSNVQYKSNLTSGEDLGLSDTAINALRWHNDMFSGKFLIPIVNFLLEQETPPPDENDFINHYDFLMEMGDEAAAKQLEYEFNNQVKKWVEKDYVRILDKIETYFHINVKEDQMYKITLNSIEKMGEKRGHKDWDAERQVSGEAITNLVFLTEIQDSIKKAKKKYNIENPEEENGIVDENPIF